MPDAFTITVANSALNLDAQGRAETAFTVSNLSKRPLRGRARVIPLGNAKAEWFSLEGEAEQNFPLNGTHQFMVRITVPPGEPPGKQSFRLNAAAVDDPDEWFAEGPTVGFEIKPFPLPVKARFPWWIVAAAAACLIGGLAAWLFLRPSEPVMPKLASHTVGEVSMILKTAGIANEVQPIVKDDDLREGPSQVIQSIPSEGQPVKPGSPIILTVSKEGARVPSMTEMVAGPGKGLPISQAVKALKDCGLRVREVLGLEFFGKVASTDPPEGTLVPIGSKVTLQFPGQNIVIITGEQAEALERPETTAKLLEDLRSKIKEKAAAGKP